MGERGAICANVVIRPTPVVLQVLLMTPLPMTRYPAAKIVDQQSLLGDLPVQLQSEVCNVLYFKLLSRVSFLVRGLQHSQEYMVELAMLLLPIPVLAGNLVVAEQTEASEMFFIETGRCRVTQATKFCSDTERELRHFQR